MESKKVKLFAANWYCLRPNLQIFLPILSEDKKKEKIKKKYLLRCIGLTSAGLSDLLALPATFPSKCPGNFLLMKGR